MTPALKAAFEREMDALKIDNTNTNMPGLYARSLDDKRLSISAIPAAADTDRVVPLGLKLERAGTVEFEARATEQIPSDMHIYLLDVETKMSQDLSRIPKYKLPLNSGTYENRFFLAFSRKENVNELMAIESLSAYAAGGNLYVTLNLLTGEKGELVVRNTIGQKVFNTNLAGFGKHTISQPFASGIYIVSFAGVRGVVTQKVFIAN